MENNPGAVQPVQPEPAGEIQLFTLSVVTDRFEQLVRALDGKPDLDPDPAIDPALLDPRSLAEIESQLRGMGLPVAGDIVRGMLDECNRRRGVGVGGQS